MAGIFSLVFYRNEVYFLPLPLALHSPTPHLLTQARFQLGMEKNHSVWVYSLSDLRESHCKAQNNGKQIKFLLMELIC